MRESDARERIARIGRSTFARGLTMGSSGNISVRLDDGWLMTPTGSSLGDLDPARIAKLDTGGNHISGDKPTKETFLHIGMYKHRADARAVVHLHSTHSVAVSCLADIDPANVIPPITAYYVMRVGTLPLVPYYRPGDPALGPAVEALAGKHHAVLLANHGPGRRRHLPRQRRLRHGGAGRDRQALPVAARPADQAADNGPGRGVEGERLSAR